MDTLMINPNSNSNSNYQISQFGPRSRTFTFDGLPSPKTVKPVSASDIDVLLTIPSLSYELEDLILARFPRSEYWKVSLFNKRCLQLSKSGDLFKIRREIKFSEASVFLLASGDNTWWSFDREFKSYRKQLPECPADAYFRYGEKESFCAGTELLVAGWEVDGQVIWRYDSVTNKWEKGGSMGTQRSSFASASCCNIAYVAGGVDEMNTRVYNDAETYNSDTKTWTILPKMNRRRKLCSGFYMDNRFYVVGGRNEEEELFCGEYFDEDKNMWVLIHDMVKFDSPAQFTVVNNELFSLEPCSNELKVYCKNTNKWKGLGKTPIKGNYHKGRGIAFKSLGDELLIIGASVDSPTSMAIYTCCPDNNVDDLKWRSLDSGREWFSHFILNCSVMIV